jgi:2-polyprenyl-3-methyl-5-hydroxy-6-metoxy-1,4-benzoquinol methylase
VADLGCGGGHSLWWAKAMGCYTIGWDIPGVRTCASVDELYHEELLYFATLNTARCDVVWCWHTIEHSDTPRDLIEAAYQILKPGGIAYFEYPEAGSFVDTSSNIYCDAHFPEHRGLPSILWMNRTAEKIGFRTIKTERPKEGRWMYGYTGSNRHIRSVLQK